MVQSLMQWLTFVLFSFFFFSCCDKSKCELWNSPTLTHTHTHTHTHTLPMNATYLTGAQLHCWDKKKGDISVLDITRFIQLRNGNSCIRWDVACSCTDGSSPSTNLLLWAAKYIKIKQYASWYCCIRKLLRRVISRTMQIYCCWDFFQSFAWIK